MTNVHQHHWRRWLIGGAAGIVIIGGTSAAVIAATGNPAPVKARTVARPPDYRACATLAAWEVTGNGGPLPQNEAVATALAEAPAPLGADATLWLNLMPLGTDRTLTAGHAVERDCQRAGVPDVLGGTATGGQ